MHQTQIKNVIFLSLGVFFLSVVAFSLHHHDKSFLLRTCSIYKVKTSISGTFSKINIDSAPGIISLCLFSMAILPFLSGILSDKKTVFIDSQIALTYPNKAPPFRS
jgi:hypothetical protein